SRIDPRMEFFNEQRKPYFFPAFKKGDLSSAPSDLKNFMTQIYPRDRYLEDNRCNSEICVPILYRMMLPIGYIRVNSRNSLTENDYSAVRKTGMSASTIISNDPHIIKSASDIIAITDISAGGIGLVFKDKHLIKHFKDKSSIIFTIHLPDEKEATMMAVVRNISLINNKFYRVGCEIVNIDPIGEVQYTEYIETISASKNAGSPK
ncbi:MAG: PilZ domain-containing protein, partial [Spirochaetota bacterium]